MFVLIAVCIARPVRNILIHRIREYVPTIHICNRHLPQENITEVYILDSGNIHNIQFEINKF